jgi:hypothetical protein
VKEITIELESTEELISIFDNTYDYFLIDKFNPNEPIEWFKSDIKTNNDFELKNASIRNLTFDLQTDFKGLVQILKLHTRQITIYQFDNPIPDTLCIEFLPQKTLSDILIKNGLKHKYSIDYEFITISSIDEKFMESIKK